MFTIRNTQFNAILKAKRQSFIQRMIEYARERYPTLCEPHDDAALGGYMDHCIKHAKQYQLVSEAQVIQFLNLIMTFGADIDVNPDFKRITAVFTTEGADDRPIAFRLKEASNKLHRIAKVHPGIILDTLIIPTT